MSQNHDNMPIYSNDYALQLKKKVLCETGFLGYQKDIKFMGTIAFLQAFSIGLSSNLCTVVGPGYSEIKEILYGTPVLECQEYEITSKRYLVLWCDNMDLK